MPDKQAKTGNNCGDYYDNLPALQVEQVKKGYFEAIYEDTVWKVKPDSNDFQVNQNLLLINTIECSIPILVKVKFLHISFM